MKIKIYKIIILSVIFLANSAFAMEQEIKQKKDSQENKEIDSGEYLPKDVIYEILKYCLDDIKYPKQKNARKSKNLNNIRIVCKDSNFLVKDFIEQKIIIDQLKKYDEINEPLFDVLNSYLLNSNNQGLSLIVNLINQGADINLESKYVSYGVDNCY